LEQKKNCFTHKKKKPQKKPADSSWVPAGNVLRHDPQAMNKKKQVSKEEKESYPTLEFPQLH
jgi:hypothetical protein